MSDFGDIESDDVVDTDPPDPEALARLFYRIRNRIAPDPSRKATLDEEDELTKILVIYVFAHIVDKLIREWQKAPL